jgi:DNA invertase Pin-like site-specific DNA recombinase
MSDPILSGPVGDAAASVRTVVCYLRTANAGTAEQRLLARQRTRLEREAAAHGWRVLEWVEDLHQSGATLARPGLHQALALLADRQAHALLTVDRARLAVTPEVVDELAAVADRQGWRLLTVETLTLPRDRRSP